MHTQIKISIASLPLLLHSILGHAAPALEAFTLKLEEGTQQYQLTLDGSGFGAPADIVLFDDFERGKDAAGELVVSSQNPLANWLPESVGLFETLADGNTGVVVNRPGDNEEAQMKLDFDTPQTELFVSFKVIIPDPHTGPDTNVRGEWSDSSSWKFLWLMDGEKGYASQDVFDFCVPTHAGRGSHGLGGNSGGVIIPETGRRLYPTGNFKELWDWDQFNKFDFWLKREQHNEALDIPDTLSLTYQTTNSLRKVLESNCDNCVMQFPDVNIQTSRIHIPGWFRTTNSPNFRAVYDDIYIATGPNARARIELSDSADYSASTMAWVLPYTSWDDSAGQITADIPKVLLDKHEELFLYVVDGNGERSKVPMKVCLKCPEPPKVI